MGVVEAQSRLQAPGIGERVVQLAIDPGEISLVANAGELVDVEGPPVRRIAAIRQHRILEVRAVLGTISVQVVQPPDQGCAVGQAGRDVGVEVDIGLVHVLLEAVGVVGHAVVGEILAQETAHVAVVGRGHCKTRGPLAETR